MMEKFWFSLISTLVLMGFLAFPMACSTSSSNPACVGDNCAADGDAQPDGDEEAVDGDEAPDGDETPDGDEITDGDEAPAACLEHEDGCCTADVDCLGATKCFEGVCVLPPVDEAEVWWENSEFDPDDMEKVGLYEQIYDGNNPAKPDLDCEGDYQDVDDAGTVTLDVKIKVFGVSAPCTTLQIQVFSQYDDAGKMRTDFSDDSALSSAFVQSAPDENFECHLEIENVPAGKWFVTKSFDVVGEETNVMFKDTYMFNNYIRPEDAGDTPFYMEITAISIISWELVPLTAGVINGIQSDRSAVVGTVKDCQGRLIANAAVGMSITATKLAYFNADVSDLLPDGTYTYTNVDGTFANVNQPSYKTNVAVVAMIDGVNTIIHSFEFLAIENSVSIYGPHGPQPSTYGWYEGPEK